MIKAPDLPLGLPCNLPKKLPLATFRRKIRFPEKQASADGDQRQKGPLGLVPRGPFAVL
jgi:hypothetical protein